MPSTPWRGLTRLCCPVRRIGANLTIATRYPRASSCALRVQPSLTASCSVACCALLMALFCGMLLCCSHITASSGDVDDPARPAWFDVWRQPRRLCRSHRRAAGLSFDRSLCGLRLPFTVALLPAAGCEYSRVLPQHTVPRHGSVRTG